MLCFAGCGSVIGPMVIAGVLIDKKNENKLRKIGVKDSKLLSPLKREKLCHLIKKIAKDYVFLKISAKEIDELRKTTNLNKIEAEKMAQIIKTMKADIAYVDAPQVSTEKFKKILLALAKNKTKIIAENYADLKYPVVSAASIIAKFERDREIENIKKIVGFDFASLPYNEKILIEDKNGIRKLIKIGELIENNKLFKKVSVFSLNIDTLKIEKFPITRFIKHKAMPLWKITLEYSGQITLTPNHAVLTLNKNGDLKFVPIDKLNIGNYIGLAGSIPPPHSITHINLKKIIKLEDTDKINISKGFMKQGKTIFPVDFNLNEDFLWLLGLYIAEGYIHDKYHIGLSCTNKKIRNKVIKIAKNMNIKPTRYKTSIVLNSRLLVKIIKSLNVGTSAKEKRFPEFAFSLSPNLLKALIRGYFDGDGFKKCKKDAAETKSFLLAEQLKWLLLFLGKFSSYSKGKNRKKHTIYVLSKDTNSLSPDNLPNPFKLLRKIRKSANLSISDLSRKSKVRFEVISNIERGKVRRVRRKTIKKLLKVYNDFRSEELIKLKKLVNSDILWAKITNIEKLNKMEKVYDIEVNPKNRHIENFIGGFGGIILHNSGYSHDARSIEFVKKCLKEKKHLEFIRHSWITVKDIKSKKEQKTLKEYK